MTSIMPSTPACKPPVIPPRSSNTTQTSSSYYFASKDSYVREDVDIEVGYYIHKEKLGEGQCQWCSISSSFVHIYI